MGNSNNATITDVILAADVPALEALCVIEDCLAHPIVVEFVFFFLIVVPKELALSSLKLMYSDKPADPSMRLE
jgi:hypothetical protein